MKIQELPEHIRQFLNEERLLNDKTIKSLQIGYTEINKQSWLTFPLGDENGNLSFYKLKAAPGNTSKNKGLVYPKGSGSALMGKNIFKKNVSRVVLCEGELDWALLVQHQIPAVTGSAGARAFQEEWLEHFPQGIEVIICYDLDDAGEKGMQDVIDKFQQHRSDVTLSRIELPKELGKGGDVTDFFRVCIENEVNPVDSLFALEEPICTPNETSEVTFEVCTLPKPQTPITVGEWRKTIIEYFPEFLLAAEASLSTITQLLIQDVTNCFALVLVDVPSAGKTITINFFDEIPQLTYSSDTFTPASFVSNAANVKKEKLSEVDLLPRIRRKMFLVRDMATIFSARDDDLMRNMGILTRVLDGEGLSTDTGIHGRRTLRGDYMFTMLAATTPIPLRVWKAMGTLGQRLFFLGLHTKTKDESTLVQQLCSTSYKEKERVCRKATRDLLHSLWNQFPNGVQWEPENEDRQYLAIIARCALLLSRLRGQVLIFKEKGEDGADLSHTVPVIEKPDRINQCFYNFARGHALASGRTSLMKEDMPLVLSLTLDSAPGHRAPLFRELLRRNGDMNTDDVEKFLQCSNPTALKEMKTLCILGICKEMDGEDLDPQKHICLSKDLLWFISDECQHLLGYTGSETLRADGSK